MLELGTQTQIHVVVVGIIKKDRGKFYRFGHIADPLEGGNYIDIHENCIIKGDEEGNEEEKLC